MSLPRQIGPFRIVRRLGMGALCEVFLALAHGASGFEKHVALKVLRPEFQGDGEAERILLDEARLAAQFHHPHLVGVHDVGAAQGRVWVRMDYLDAGDLATRTATQLLPEVLGLHVALALAYALDYLHALRDEAGRPLGVVHRDISPSNILLSRAGTVTLGDFGIAKSTLHREDTRAGVRKGKYAYMSPEQVRAEPLSAASDLFSLGVTLAELLTGTRPFDGDGPLATLENIRDAVPPPFPTLAPDLADLLRACLARSPSERPASAAALARMLERTMALRGTVSPLDVRAWLDAHPAPP